MYQSEKIRKIKFSLFKKEYLKKNFDFSKSFSSMKNLKYFYIYGKKRDEN